MGLQGVPNPATGSWGGEFPGGGLSSFLNGSSGMMGPIGMGLQVLGTVGGYVAANQASKKGEKIATGNQENLQRTAMEIQDAVNSGKMRPEAALYALQQLQQQAQTMGGSGSGVGTGNFNQAGALTAGIIINNVIANVRQKLAGSADALVNAPLPNAGAPSQGSSSTPSAGGGAPPDQSAPGMDTSSNPLAGAGSNESLQNTVLRSKLRSYLMGQTDNGIGQSPIGDMLKPASPFQYLDQAQAATRKAAPPVMSDDQISKIGQF